MASYYELLGVDPEADQDAIRAAYAAAIRGGAHAEGTTGPHDRRLDEAYAVIGEPSRRARYDELRSTEGAGGNPELLTLLALIADTGSIPTAEDVLDPPPDIAPPGEAAGAADVEGAAALTGEANDAATPILTPLGTAPVPGTDGTRRDLGRRRTLIGVVLLALVVGVVGTLLRTGGTDEPAGFAVGDCVALEDGRATGVPCDDAAATARIAEIAPAPEGCQAAVLGTIDLGADGVGCLERAAPVEADAVEQPDEG